MTDNMSSATHSPVKLGIIMQKSHLVHLETALGQKANEETAERVHGHSGRKVPTQDGNRGYSLEHRFQSSAVGTPLHTAADKSTGLPGRPLPRWGLRPGRVRAAPLLLLPPATCCRVRSQLRDAGSLLPLSPSGAKALPQAQLMKEARALPALPGAQRQWVYRQRGGSSTGSSAEFLELRVTLRDACHPAHSHLQGPG